MKAKAPRSVALKALAVLIGLLAAVAVAFWIWVDSVADRRWEELRERVLKLEAEARAREDERPVLRGTPVPGRAWEDYEQALTEAGRIAGGGTELAEFVGRTSMANPSAVKAILSAHSILLDHVARGAQRSIGPRRYDWEKGVLQPLPSLLGSQVVSNYIGCKGRLLAAEGKTGEALDILLDGCQFGRDLADNSTLICEMVGIAMSRMCLDEIHSMLVSGVFSRAELERLDRALNILDDTYPSHEAIMRNETLVTGRTVTGNFPDSWDEGIGISALSGWRYGFSRRLMLADALFRLEELTDRIAPEEGKSWTEVRRICDEFQNELEGTDNPAFEWIIVVPQQAIRPVRRLRACLRLLRAAVSLKLSGKVPEINDPFGEKLLHSHAGGIRKIWSVGRNGIDDGGTGGWESGGDPDIVLEVKE